MVAFRKKSGGFSAFLISLCCLFLLLRKTSAWIPHTQCSLSRQRLQENRLKVSASPNNNEELQIEIATTSRRQLLLQSAAVAATSANALLTSPTLAQAAASSTTTEAQVTDRIFLEMKGLGPEPKRLVIGLFGNEAPQSTQKLKQLASKQGLPAPCKAKAQRALQKEQLEANKVYSSCMESQDNGVNYEYASIWRVIPNGRIDVGAVSGRFIAREYPTWQEDKPMTLKHDSPGVVSVRKGSDSGFGFTIFPGGDKEAAAELDEDHIVVGKVENLDVVKELNQVPVVTTSKQVNFMSLTGGPSTKSAPSRACTYGGAMYCNEYKPLIKLTIMNSGIL